MNEFQFTLSFAVPVGTLLTDALTDAFFEAGCDDAMIGFGRPGCLAFDFTRAAETASAALTSAERDVVSALPSAVLTEAGPDLVNLSDMAALFGCSRQNMQKYASGSGEKRGAFPLPLVSTAPPLWRLLDIVRWVQREKLWDLPPSLADLAAETARLNLRLQLKKLEAVA
ncbi:DNA-binding protein [Elstera cyanobacteriorum]|uniref:DNA-binding protein n=1 Tax=Elstera cyanobacteriorum TaxID=2022747 RepID=A0A255XNB6_9PROT|nr:hypothetical protein [Elstera cyanobacteriorum]OYQ17874.1 hypothetical protein CHR90_12935 [Elstera cyanobacteriorum]GFZ85448.1 DNA-binding protein [Elstera cyanobacteriorum]